MKKNEKQETTTAILEALQGIKTKDDSIGAIIQTAIAAVKTAEKKAKKKAELTALATVLKCTVEDLSVLDDDQLAVVQAVPDGQKLAVYSAFKIAANLAAENQALKRPQSAKKAEKKAEKLTLKQAYTCLQAYEAITFKSGTVPIALSALLGEPLRFLRCNMKSAAKTAAMAENYEASFRASYLTDEYIQKLADFIGPRFIDDRNEVESSLAEAVKSAKEELLKLVP